MVRGKSSVIFMIPLFHPAVLNRTKGCGLRMNVSYKILFHGLMD